VSLGYREGANFTEVFPEHMQSATANHLTVFHGNHKFLDGFIEHDQFFSQQDARDDERLNQVANNPNITGRGRPNRHTCGKLAHRSRLVVTPPPADS
jgi:hypothetical protein